MCGCVRVCVWVRGCVQVCKLLETWEFVVDSAVSDLIAARPLLAEHHSEYLVKDDRIGYREQDSISFNVSYGYLTILAYLKVSPP